MLKFTMHQFQRLDTGQLAIPGKILPPLLVPKERLSALRLALLEQQFGRVIP